MERLSDNYRHILKNEVLFVIDKMKASNNADQKLFFFSAIYAMIQRIINLEYNSDLVFAYHVIQRTHESFAQRLAALKAGDPAVLITDEHFIALEKAIMEFYRALDKKTSPSSALKAFSIVTYSITGNGRYLIEKGMLKISG